MTLALCIFAAWALCAALVVLLCRAAAAADRAGSGAGAAPDPQVPAALPGAAPVRVVDLRGASRRGHGRELAGVR